MTSSPSRRPEAFEPEPDELEPPSVRVTDINPAAAEPLARVPGEPGGMRDRVAGMDQPSVPRAGPGLGRRAWAWGLWLAGSLGGLAMLALGLWFARLTAIALDRQDWIGWIAFVLLATAAAALVGLVGREVLGLMRVRRLGQVKREAERALLSRDLEFERQACARILEPLSDRPELRWAMSRLEEHARQVRDPGDLLRLTDRDVLMVLDGAARRLVAGSARRVGIVSAMSPAALLTMSWVLVENLRLLRALAGLYGGRPGFVGTARLLRMVMVHILATGGLALTDDLLGQFLGQDLLRRLSRRLGESVFNAALTARVGAAAIEVIRPLPFIEAPPVRARDFIGEIVRRSTTPRAAAQARPPRADAPESGG